MLNANATSHYKTLKGLTKSAEYSRSKLLEQVKEPAGGIYKVRMQNSDNWELMSLPPVKGASEWLYLNASGMPIYYWNQEQSGLMLI